jgi:hypothetical protein
MSKSIASFYDDDEKMHYELMGVGSQSEKNEIKFVGTSRRCGKTDTVKMQDDDKDKTERKNTDCNQWRVPVLPSRERQRWEEHKWIEYMANQLNERVYLESTRNRKATDKYDQAVRDTPSGKCMIHDRKDKKFDFDFACKFCCEKQKTNPKWLCYWLDEKMCAKMLPSAKQITCNCLTKVAMKTFPGARIQHTDIHNNNIGVEIFVGSDRSKDRNILGDSPVTAFYKRFVVLNVEDIDNDDDEEQERASPAENSLYELD